MSISISYFFNSEKSLSELATEINAIIGCALRPSKGLPDKAHTAFPFFGMEFDLSIYPIEYPYEDDDELKFSLYNYELDTTTYSGQGDARPVQLSILLSAIYILYRRLGITGMLVYDVQALLARYEERAMPNNRHGLFDTVSQSFFHPLGGHLQKLESLLPDYWQ